MDGSNNQTSNINNDNSSISGLNARRDNIPDPTLELPVGHDRGIDNPLLAKTGVPVTLDDLRDSTERIINASTTNIMRDPNNLNIFNVESGDLFNVTDQNDPNKRFDLKKFNKVFDINRDLTKQNQKLRDIEYLNKLSSVETKTSLYDLNISQIIINTKNSWFNLLDEMLDRNVKDYDLNMISKDNRLFYVGLTIIVICVILYVYITMVDK